MHVWFWYIVPCICWRDNRAGHKQSRRFLRPISNNFLIQVTEEPIRRGAVLDLMLSKKQELIRYLKV